MKINLSHMNQRLREKFGKYVGENVLAIIIAIVLLLFTYNINKALHKMDKMITKTDTEELMNATLKPIIVTINQNTNNMSLIGAKYESINQNILLIKEDIGYLKAKVGD